MVGGRRQRKSSRAGGKNPELIMSAPDTTSPLVSLPPEIQGIITNYVSLLTSNAAEAYTYYFANWALLACSITRPEPPLLHL